MNERSLLLFKQQVSSFQNAAKSEDTRSMRAFAASLYKQHPILTASLKDNLESGQEHLGRSSLYVVTAEISTGT